MMIRTPSTAATLMLGASTIALAHPRRSEQVRRCGPVDKVEGNQTAGREIGCRCADEDLPHGSERNRVCRNVPDQRQGRASIKAR
jgi:hypothetical protein